MRKNSLKIYKQSARQYFLENIGFKSTLIVLYSVIWLWGMAGKKNIIWRRLYIYNSQTFEIELCLLILNIDLSFAGNLLVVITIFRFMNRKNVIYILIANLSVSDLLVIGFALPSRVSSFFLNPTKLPK